MQENIYRKKIRLWQKKYGGLSKTAQDKLSALIVEYEKTLNIEPTCKSLKIAPGTRVVREYRGKKYSVLVLADGYEYNGYKYKSLSAIANKITGKHWNGKKFFGLS